MANYLTDAQVQPALVKAQRFNFDAAKRRAEKLGLVVVSVCHASIPRGVPPQDGTGNYIKAKTVYIGKPGAMEHNCAYARCYSTIHQIVDPGMGEALSSICGHLAYYDTFNGSRADYEAYFNSPYPLLPHQKAELAESWHEHTTTAQRAILRLPAEMITWLRSVYADT